MNNQLILRRIRRSDCQEIHQAFQKQNWDKPITQYLQYFYCQEKGERDIIIAELNGHFAGYLTIKWRSGYIPFQKKNIPEIVDLNVLKKHQRLGIGSRLMDEAERRIKKTSDYAGIGVGVYEDYGPAQVLYIKRGYIPDGKGIVRNSTPLKLGDRTEIDHGLILCLSKKL